MTAALSDQNQALMEKVLGISEPNSSSYDAARAGEDADGYNLSTEELNRLMDAVRADAIMGTKP